MLTIPLKLIHIHHIKLEDPKDNLMRIFSDDPKPSKLHKYLNSISLKPGIHYAIRNAKIYSFLENKTSPLKTNIIKNKIKWLLEENINESGIPSGKHMKLDVIPESGLIFADSLFHHERDDIYRKGINPITTFTYSGLIIFGQLAVTKNGIQPMVEYDYFNRRGKINSDFLDMIKEA